MATAWSITWRSISIGKSAIIIFSFSTLNEWVAYIFKILAASEISFKHAVQLPFAILLYSTFPDNYAFSHYHLQNSKTLSQLTQFPFTGTLLLFDPETCYSHHYWQEGSYSEQVK